MKLGVLGGTFDPPHIGHLVLAELAREQLNLDKVAFLPAGDPWRKVVRDVTPARHRLEMTRLAIADNAAFEVDDREVRQEGPSYTAVTLRQIRQSRPGIEDLYFILGQDALADLPFWHEPAQIAEAALIAVVPREAAELAPALPFAPERLVHIEMPSLAISSTDLRERARRGLSLRYLVPAAVEAYIKQQRLYRP